MISIDPENAPWGTGSIADTLPSLHRLRARDAEVWRRYYVGEETHAGIGSSLGICAERVQQLKRRANMELQHGVRNKVPGHLAATYKRYVTHSPHSDEERAAWLRYARDETQTFVSIDRVFGRPTGWTSRVVKSVMFWAIAERRDDVLFRRCLRRGPKLPLWVADRIGLRASAQYLADCAAILRTVGTT